MNHKFKVGDLVRLRKNSIGSLIDPREGNVCLILKEVSSGERISRTIFCFMYYV